MLQTKFQVFELRGSKKRKSFSMYSYGSNPEHPVAGPF